MDLQGYLNTLGFVDLISAKHQRLRQILMNRISQEIEIKLSAMDIYLLDLNGYCPLSVSESARHMNLSRQAVHKQAKHLIELNLIQLLPSELNRRDKVIALTPAGVQLNQEISVIKKEFNQELQARLGEQNFSQIEALFSTDWELDE